MSVPNFIEILDRMKSIHEKKNQDYSVSQDAFSNFEQAAIISSWFNDPTAKVFATLIGVKLSRIANLMNKGGEPNNESLDDSFLDNEVYSLLFHCWYLNRSSQKDQGSTVANVTPKVDFLLSRGYKFDPINKQWYPKEKSGIYFSTELNSDEPLTSLDSIVKFLGR